MLLRLPQFQIEATERRTAIAGNEAGGIDAGSAVAHLLHQRQAHQGLHAGQKDAAFLACVFVIKGVIGIDDRKGSGHVQAPVMRSGEGAQSIAVI